MFSGARDRFRAEPAAPAMTKSIYLDYAATSAVRPPEVAEAVARYLTDVGATPGRSGHLRSIAAGRLALRCRRKLAELFGLEGDPGRIAFQLNATYALNTAILGVVDPGDRVIRTGYDHNSVRRPAAALTRMGVRVDRIDVDRQGEVDLQQVDDLLRDGPPPRLVVLPHASNVTGVVLPVREIAERARARGSLVLLDLAQTAGHYPVDLMDLGADMAAFTGHKGLLGPQGTGGLWVREGVDVRPLAFGGTGGDSQPEDMPDAYPDHLEAGTQNAPGIAGLAAGVEWVLERSVLELHRKETGLKSRLLNGIATVSDVRIVSPRDPEGVGIVSLVHDRLPSSELAAAVERSHGVQGRAGLHCAPEAHEILGTSGNGAFRLSIGWATSESDIDAAVEALRAIPN